MTLYTDWMFKRTAEDRMAVEDAIQNLIGSFAELIREDNLEALKDAEYEPTRADLDALHELDPHSEADEAYCQSSYEDPHER